MSHVSPLFAIPGYCTADRLAFLVASQRACRKAVTSLTTSRAFDPADSAGRVGCLNAGRLGTSLDSPGPPSTMTCSSFVD